MMTEEKRKKVRNILLTPIECNNCKSFSIRIGYDSDNNEILPSKGKFTNARIISSQKYRNTLDPDMSDLTIEFYNIVYSDILKSKKILKENGTLENCNFAGDTMNSFNSIANNVPEAGQSKKQRTEKEDWPAFLQEYYNQYHCLANFWILPMRLGRTGKKLNHYDSIDIFLNSLKEEYSILEKYIDYNEQLKTFDEFCKKHFIKNCKILSADAVRKMYRKSSDKKDKAEEKIKDCQMLVEQAYKFMELRAEGISSNDNICEKLYNRFAELKILY